MLDLDKEEAASLEVQFKGEVYKLSHPNVGDIENLQRDMKEGKGEEVGVLLGFLEKQGLPKDIGREMSTSQLKKISDAMNEVKKN